MLEENSITSLAQKDSNIIRVFEHKYLYWLIKRLDFDDFPDTLHYIPYLIYIPSPWYRCPLMAVCTLVKVCFTVELCLYLTWANLAATIFRFSDSEPYAWICWAICDNTSLDLNISVTVARYVILPPQIILHGLFSLSISSSKVKEVIGATKQILIGISKHTTLILGSSRFWHIECNKSRLLGDSPQHNDSSISIFEVLQLYPLTVYQCAVILFVGVVYYCRSNVNLKRCIVSLTMYI